MRATAGQRRAENQVTVPRWAVSLAIAVYAGSTSWTLWALVFRPAIAGH